jgi:hypothetical protein
MNYKYLLGILLLALIITPAMAFHQTYNAPSGQAVYVVQIYVNGGTTGIINFHQSNGDTTSGTWSYSNINMGIPPSSHATLSIGPATASTNFVTLGQLVVSYNPSYNESAKITASMGQTKIIANEMIETSVKAYPITSFDISSDNDVIVTVRYYPTEQATSELNPTGGAVTYVMSLIWSFISFIKGLFFWIGFFFVTGIAMITALYIAITGAISFGSGKNIFTALKKFFKYQKAYVEFIIYLWSTLIQIASYIRGMFKLI